MRELVNRSLPESTLSFEKSRLCCLDVLGVSWVSQFDNSQLSPSMLYFPYLLSGRRSPPRSEFIERIRAIGGSIPPFSSFLSLFKLVGTDGIPLSGREDTRLCAAGMLFSVAALPCWVEWVAAGNYPCGELWRMLLNSVVLAIRFNVFVYVQEYSECGVNDSVKRLNLVVQLVVVLVLLGS